MPAVLCAVSGIVYLPSGVLAANATLRFARASFDSHGATGLVVPTHATMATTNAAGELAVNLMSGNWTLYYQDSYGKLYWVPFAVPATATADLQAIIDANAYIAVTAPEIVAAVAAMRDQAEVYAASAEVSATAAEDAADRAEAADLSQPLFRGAFSDLMAVTPAQVAVGGFLETPDGKYQRAPDAATDHHITTTNGVKLYIVNAGKGASIDAIGALGNGTASDSAAFAAAALIGGKWTLRSGATYRAANVSLAANGTSFACPGVCHITKNANGPIFSGPATDMVHAGIIFRGGPTSGSGFTGPNLDFTGVRNTLVNCGSMWAHGPAVKSAAKIDIISPVGVIQTDDASGTGFDVEVGNSVTSTSYSSFQDIDSSQATGGMSFINPGMMFVMGSAFGKIKTTNVGSPPGINGGTFIGNRILGNASIGVANTMMTGNQFSAVSLTLEPGITGCLFDNIHAGGASVIDNSGNRTNTIIRRESSVTSNVGLTSNANVLRQGDDTNSVWWATHTLTNNVEFSGSLSALNFGVPNLGAYRVRTNSGTVVPALTMDASNNIFVGSGSSNYTSVLSGSGGVYFSISGASVLQAYTTGFRPQVDNVMALGTTSQAWSDVQSHKVTTRPKTVATLPAGAAGARSFVTDSSVAASGNFGAIVAGGGANGVPVYHDGTNWRIG